MTTTWPGAATGSDSVARVSRSVETEPRSASPTPKRRGCCCATPFSTACARCCSTRDWSSITLSDVAKAAGISRQTIYNEFGSRQGLAQGYALRLADRLVDQIDGAIDGNVGDIYAAFLQGFRDFFAESAADPLVISLLTGDVEARPAADHHHRQRADHHALLAAADRDRS